MTDRREMSDIIRSIGTPPERPSTTETWRGFETRLPLSLLNAEVVITGTLPDGTKIEMRAEDVRFDNPGGAAVVMVREERFSRDPYTLYPPSDYYLDLDAKMIPNDKGHVYTIKVLDS